MNSSEFCKVYFLSDLNNGKSVQLAIVRTQHNTTLHVNEYNVTLMVGYKPLTEYTNKPWSNPELGE